MGHTTRDAHGPFRTPDRRSTGTALRIPGTSPRSRTYPRTCHSRRARTPTDRRSSADSGSWGTGRSGGLRTRRRRPASRCRRRSGGREALRRAGEIARHHLEIEPFLPDAQVVVEERPADAEQRIEEDQHHVDTEIDVPLLTPEEFGDDAE